MQTISFDTIKKSVIGTVRETYETMLDMEIGVVEEITDKGMDENRLVGVVNFGGEVVGMMSIQVSTAFSRLMTAAMLGMELEEVKEEEVKDVLGEVSNIITGNLKSVFLDTGLSCVISTPSITSGSDFQIDPIDIAPPKHIFFKHEEYNLLVELVAREDIGAKVESGLDSGMSGDDIVNKINQVDIRNQVINSVIDVYYTMLSMEVQHIPKVPESFQEELRTVATVTFAGDVDGLFNIQVNDDFGRIMAANLLGMEVEEIEEVEDMYDVIREMSNIIGGNLKSAFVDVGLSCVLSTPSITNGRDFRVEPLNVIDPHRFLFAYEEHTIIVEAGIKNDLAAAAAIAVEKNDEVELAESTDQPQEEGDNLDFLLDIPLEVTVELGRAKRRVNEVLKIGEGSVVELNQLEGQPVDILVNQTLIARGVVVVEKEKYGIRISEIISRKDRIRSFK